MTMRLSVILALGLFACGDDAAPADTTGPDLPETVDTTPDTAIEATAETETAVDVPPSETGEVDLCGGITCTDIPAAECSPDRLSVWAFGQAGTCEVDDEGFSLCRYPVNETRCSEGQACIVGAQGPACGTPVETCDVALSRAATWISAVRIPTAADASQCCFDFDGDGDIDNGLADLVATLSPLFDANPQNFVDKFIARGLNAYLLQYRGLDDLANDANIGIDMLIGFDADGDYNDNLAGTEQFKVRAPSYAGATPKSTFSTASTSNFVLRARSPEMGFLMPLALDPFVAAVRDVRLDARVILGDNGRGLTLGAVGQDIGARFGALFPLSEVFRAINTYVKDACGCLDLAGLDLITAQGGGWQCESAGSSACNPEDDDESICIDLAGYCSAAVLLVSPDVGDSISLGFWIQGLSAGLDGFVDANDQALVCE